jgi:hypothetical protein
MLIMKIIIKKLKRNWNSIFKNNLEASFYLETEKCINSYGKDTNVVMSFIYDYLKRLKKIG